MHNIATNFGRFFEISKELFEGEMGNKGNFQFYPKSSPMADLEVMTLCCLMEALSIDSENPFWSKLEKITLIYFLI